MNGPLLPARSRDVPVLASGLFALHLGLAGRYGIFRDELYYAACGEHLAFGYVDHPPLVALMAKVSRLAFGDSVRGLRVLPALCAAATVLLAAELARAMKGGRFAQVLAALCAVVAPEYLGEDHILSMNCALPVLWSAASLFAIEALESGRPRAWIGVGLACGLGLLAKHSTLFFGAALVAGIVVGPRRRVLLTRGPWTAFAIAALLVAPNLAWEARHGWPTLEFMHNAQARKMVEMSVPVFLRELALVMQPATLPVWCGGVAWMLLGRTGQAVRFLGVAFLGTIAIIALAHGKPYYAAPVFPVAYAAGGVVVERWIERTVARAVVVGAIAVAGAVLAPLAIPVLGLESYARYADALGVRAAANEKHRMGPLPQHFADQLGWEAMAGKVAAAYRGLSADEQRVATIYGSNYGEAGAIDFFGPRWGLPRAVSGHNSYYLWGPPGEGRGAVLIAVGEDREDLERTYERVSPAGETDEPYAMPYENHLTIFVCRGLKRDLAAVWPSTKNFI